MMDQWKPEGFFQSIPTDIAVSDLQHSAVDHLVPSNGLQNSQPNSSQRAEVEVKNSVAARKVQKADREKLRRDRLNEQFLELGNALDPDRPKHDKATILTDTIHMLKDLTAQVNKLKAEYTALSEESRELTQEKNELREEKTSIKSEIDNLNIQYQQRVGVMYPWATMDPSVVMAPPSYPFPVPVPVPSGPIPMHPQSMQLYPFFRNQTPSAIPNPCSTYVPYSSPINPQSEHVSTRYVSPQQQPTSRSHTPGKHDSRSKTPDRQRGSNVERSDGSHDVATDLELKTPGSTADQEISSGVRKGKQSQRKESSITVGSSSSRCSSSMGVQDSSSNSVGNGRQITKEP